MDLSFLDTDSKMDQFVNQLFNFHVLVFNNDDFDLRVVTVERSDMLHDVMMEYFENIDKATSVVIQNGRTDDRIPFFKIVMEEYSPKTPINYKLETFFRRSGIIGVSSRCKIAMVVGLMSSDMDAIMVDIPLEYHTIPIPSLEGVDLTGTGESVKAHAGDYLMNIPGIPLPYELPQEIHWNIMKYLRRPEAEEINHRIGFVQSVLDSYDQFLERLGAYYDEHFANIFSTAPW